jgi:hypothetical protein
LPEFLELSLEQTMTVLEVVEHHVRVPCLAVIMVPTVLKGLYVLRQDEELLSMNFFPDLPRL